MNFESRRRLSLGLPVSYGVSAVDKRLDAFRRHWPLQGDRLLDVGCGNGAYTTAMAQGFCEVYGVDVEPERLREFRAKVDGDPRFHVFQANAEHLEFPDGHFDTVTAVEVIEHIPGLDAALSEIHRVLRPGGAFLVSCPNRLFPLETHTVEFGRGREYPARWVPFLPYLVPVHRRISTARNFTRKDLYERLCPLGFEVVAWDWIMPPLDHWRLGRRFLRPALDRLERSPLRQFGVSIIGVFAKAT